jgi:hypothetical protein
VEIRIAPFSILLLEYSRRVKGLSKLCSDTRSRQRYTLGWMEQAEFIVVSLKIHVAHGVVCSSSLSRRPGSCFRGLVAWSKRS